MRRFSTRLYKYPESVIEMLTIRCSGTPNNGQQYPYREQSSKATFPNVSPLHSPSNTNQPRSKSKPSPSQQHTEYRNISNQWQVPRTSLHHFPEEAQSAIINNIGRNKKQSKSVQSPPAQSLPQLAPEITSQMNLILAALNYEVSRNFSNFLGKSGQLFSEWMAEKLLNVSRDLIQSSTPHKQRLSALSTQFSQYNALSTLQQRRELVTSASAIIHIILDHPPFTSSQDDSFANNQIHPLRSQRYAPSITSSSSHNTRNIIERGREPEEMPVLPHTPAELKPLGNSVKQEQEQEEVEQQQQQLDSLAEEAHREETFSPTGTLSSSSFSLSSPSHVQETPNSMMPPPPPTISTAQNTNTKRKIKPSTLAFRESFQEAALFQAHNSPQRGVSIDDLSHGEQRTTQWLSLRERRLTASAFSKALGFFQGDRISLWEEKVGLKAPFSGNEATRWGTKSEPIALERYREMTGRVVEVCMFKVKHDDAPHGWLGASPDGLLCGLTTTHSSHHSRESMRDGYCMSDTFNGPGILEIKCPFNKGRPELALPPQHAIWYYMPQLQGLMDIFDREWCNLFIWTQNNGSAAFYIPRNREYWAAAFDVLAEFWWVHVVPARQAYDRGAPMEEIEAFRPSEVHPASAELKMWSKRLAADAKGERYS